MIAVRKKIEYINNNVTVYIKTANNSSFPIPINKEILRMYKRRQLARIMKQELRTMGYEERHMLFRLMWAEMRLSITLPLCLLLARAVEGGYKLQKKINYILYGECSVNKKKENMNSREKFYNNKI